jgi:hypothetical protein
MMGDKIEVDLGKACELLRPSQDSVWWEVTPADAANLQTFAGENQSLVVVPQVAGTFHVLAIHGKSRDWYQIQAVSASKKHQLMPMVSALWRGLPSFRVLKPVGILLLFLGLSFGVNKYLPSILDRLKPNPRPTPVVPVDKDPLIDAARFAFQTEFSPTKLDDAAKFAQVYRHAVAISKTSPTLGKVYAGIGAKVSELGLQGKLPNVQAVINAEFAKVLPNPIDNPDLTNDAASQALLARQFLRAAYAFEALQ